MGLDITPEALAELLEAGEGPVTLVNLVRLRPGGEAAYARYREAIEPVLARLDGEVLYAGPYVMTLIGDDRWDFAAVTRYGDRREVAKLVDDADFQAATALRHAALEAGVLHVFA